MTRCLSPQQRCSIPPASCPHPTHLHPSTSQSIPEHPTHISPASQHILAHPNASGCQAWPAPCPPPCSSWFLQLHQLFAAPTAQEQHFSSLAAGRRQGSCATALTGLSLKMLLTGMCRELRERETKIVISVWKMFKGFLQKIGKLFWEYKLVSH